MYEFVSPSHSHSLSLFGFNINVLELGKKLIEMCVCVDKNKTDAGQEGSPESSRRRSRKN